MPGGVLDAEIVSAAASCATAPPAFNRMMSTRVAKVRAARNRIASPL